MSVARSLAFAALLKSSVGTPKSSRHPARRLKAHPIRGPWDTMKDGLPPENAMAVRTPFLFFS